MGDLSAGRTGREPLEPKDAVSHVLDECRMVLPGIQALFGFQLIAFFNQGFTDKLSQAQQALHLGATLAVAVAAGLVMTPASLHRQAEKMSVSFRFVATASRFLLASMVPLALGICTDVYLVSHMVLRDTAAALAVAGGLFLFLALFWLVFPRVWRRD
ncbi:MAG TPA: DUF6328 family protein [Longimicrobium sp.]|nr:DUF6328 family protein [Longimicrobium sp.]